MNDKTIEQADDVDLYLERLTDALQHGSESDEVKRLLASPPRPELLRLAEDVVELRRAYEATLADERQSPQGILSPTKAALSDGQRPEAKKRHLDVTGALIAVALVLACTWIMVSQQPGAGEPMRAADAERIAKNAAEEALKQLPKEQRTEQPSISPQAVAEELVSNDQFPKIVRHAVSAALTDAQTQYVKVAKQREAAGTEVWTTTTVNDVIEAFQPRNQLLTGSAPLVAIMTDSEGNPTKGFFIDRATNKGTKFDVDPKSYELSDFAVIESSDKRKLQKLFEALQKSGAKVAEEFPDALNGGDYEWCSEPTTVEVE